jgi:hypothetical protein
MLSWAVSSTLASCFSCDSPNSTSCSSSCYSPTFSSLYCEWPESFLAGVSKVIWSVAGTSCVVQVGVSNNASSSATLRCLIVGTNTIPRDTTVFVFSNVAIPASFRTGTFRVMCDTKMTCSTCHLGGFVQNNSYCRF